MAKRIRLALDVTPNTIHTGFYVAQAKGWYENAGIELVFISPDEDAYATSPTQKMQEGLADLAITASTHVIQSQIEADNVFLIAVAAVLARDASAIVALEQSGVERPADLDDKTYAARNTPFENLILRQFVLNDGGRGDFHLIYPESSDTWSTLLNGGADATSIFLPWQGVEARLKNIALQTFQVSDYGIPFSYNSLIVTQSDFITNEARLLKSFLQITAQGYQFAKNNPFEAARILQESAPQLAATDADFIEQSQVFVTQYYLDEQGRWGLMQIKVWENFVAWLLEKDILQSNQDIAVKDLEVYQLFTNEFFES